MEYINLQNTRRIKMKKLSKILPIPSKWSDQKKEVKEIVLSANSSEYRKVKSMLRNESLQYLKKITRVQNPYLLHRYLLRKLEYKCLRISCKERTLVHATSKSKIPSIIKNNLDWRLVRRAKFGKGVSFSSCTRYANKECSSSNGTKRAMIIAKVLVGRKHGGNPSTTIPKKGYDTTSGNGSKVYVKYYDDEFYPEYIAYYDNLPCINELDLDLS